MKVCGDSGQYQSAYPVTSNITEATQFVREIKPVPNVRARNPLLRNLSFARERIFIGRHQHVKIVVLRLQLIRFGI